MRLFTIICFIGIAQALTGQEATLYATAAGAGFDTISLQEYADHPAYQYAKNTPEGSLLDTWWKALKDQLRRMFADGRNSWYNILYLVLISTGLILMIYYLTKSRFRSVFKNRDDAQRVGHILDTELPTTSLDVLIAGAIADGNDRLSFRWAYLDLLRKLHDLGLLKLHREKTNRDYKRDMHRHSGSGVFVSLADTFDQIWYGGYPMDERAFNQHRNAMLQMLSESKTA
jgi:hypothetical protein